MWKLKNFSVIQTFVAKNSRALNYDFGGVLLQRGRNLNPKFFKGEIRGTPSGLPTYVPHCDHDSKMTGLFIKGACLNIYIFCWQAKDVYSVTLFVLSSQCGLNSSSEGRTGPAFTHKAFLLLKPNSAIKC